METIILVIHLMLAVAIIALVLMQRSTGGGLGLGGGGGMGDFATARSTATALTRATTYCAIAFFCTSLTLAYLAGHHNQGSVLDTLAEQEADMMDAINNLPVEINVTPPTPAAAPTEPEVPTGN